MSEKRPKQFDIVAFKVPDHRSLLYSSWLPVEALHNALNDAIEKGANVISIRLVEVERP
jgi:hypothetical protein